MEDINHNLIEYLKVFFRRKWFIVIPTFAGLVLGICTAMMLPKEYLSATKILIEEGKNDNPLFNNLAVSTSTAQRIQTIKETMLGWNSISELVKRLKLDKNVHNQLDMELLIKKIQGKIAFDGIGPNIIEIAYISPDPVQAQAIVQNVTNIFIERNVNAQNRETAEAIKFIEEQLHVYLGKIKSSEIADLKDKLNALLVDSTEMHPDVKALRAAIAKKMSDLEAQHLEYSENVKLNSETTNPMLTQIQQALQTIGQKAVTNESAADKNSPVGEKDLYKVMLMDKLGGVMARDVNVNETIYTSLLQRLETAKITQRLQSSSEGTKYTIIEQARIAVKPVRPNKPLVAFMGLFLGLGLGIALIFATEFLDKSFLDAHEASAYLGAPLLGSISKINTVESIEESKRKQMELLFWMGTVGVLMIALTVMFSSFKHV
jgi:succinoglycan biosynthesis transport protein ExoP